MSVKTKKNKRILSISAASTFFAALASSTFILGLTSCASNSAVSTTPATNASSFSSLNTSVLPVAASALSVESGRSSVVQTYLNNALKNWFNVVSNNSIEIAVEDWYKTANKNYDDKLKDYQKNKGKEWRQLFQSQVLDPVGGTKELYILNQVKANFKTKITDNLFGSSAKNYLVYSQNPNSSNPVFTKISDINLQELQKQNNSYVNGQSVGTKNGFTFNIAALDANQQLRIDVGFSDLMEFIMDDWIIHNLPLPLSMSLWKNSTDSFTMNQLFSSYFDRYNTPSSSSDSEESSESKNPFTPSYQFQFFDSSSNNPTSLTTTDKFNRLMTGLLNGLYVDKTTGLVDLPVDYTEDSSTVLLTNSSGLFDGTYVTPFSSAAWYKLSNYVFGINDSNITVASKLNVDSIMDNFLLYKTGTTGHVNVKSSSTSKATEPLNFFEFPYSVEWQNDASQTNTSVFSGDYRDVIGITDIINFSDQTTKYDPTTSSTPQQPATGQQSTTQNTTSNSTLEQFILVRNQFGVHIIGIDRISKLKEAYNASGANSFDAKFKNVCNELRNTFIYYYALDNAANTTKYNVKDMLRTYFDNNFESIIYRYIRQYVDNPTANKNNLFGAYVTKNDESTIDYNSNYGFNINSSNNDEKEYIANLDKISRSAYLRSLIDASFEYEYAISARNFIDSINSKIYDNQKQYNQNSDPNKWLVNGLAGVLQFTRNSTTGEFSSLTSLINSIVTNKTPMTTINQINSGFNVNRQLSNNVTNVTPTDVKTNLTSKKNKYQSAVTNYLNTANVTVANSVNKYFAVPTYLFTSDEYVNGALIAIGSSALSTIVNNMYTQKYLYANGLFKNTNPNAAEGTMDWIINKVKNSIDSIYKVSQFTKDNNVYSLGDWSTYDEFKQKSVEFFDGKINDNQFNFSFNADGSPTTQFFSFNNYDDINSYYKLLTTIRYVLGYNSEYNVCNFKPLFKLLDKATDVSSNLRSAKAAVAWTSQDSIVVNQNFGYNITNNTSTNKLELTTVQTQSQTDTTFKKNPLLLTNVNSYSWNGATNPYSTTNSSSSSPSTSDLTYTTNSKYWISSPMTNTVNSTSNQTLSTGFLGFQLQQSSELTSSLPSSWTNNSSYSSLPVGETNLNYIGMLYAYGSRQNLIDLITNIDSQYWLVDFYNTNLVNSGLPIFESSYNNINTILSDEFSSIDSRLNKLKNSLIEIINDTTQVPNKAFEKMSQLPLWQKNGNSYTTLFDTSSETSGLKNQYFLTQFNNNDVRKLVTDPNYGTENVTLVSGSNGYLGLNPQTFFDAIVMLCSDSTTLSNDATQNMYETNGKIVVYDIRLLNVIQRNYVSNYEEWLKIQNLS